MYMNKVKLTLIACFALLAMGCNKFEGDVTVPSFVRIDALEVEKAAVGEVGRSDGWYTADIDAVQLIAYFDGDEAETNLGAFQLPCTVPVLRVGTMKYLRVVPVVKQNGIAATRIAYPYYRDTTFTDIVLRENDTTCVGELDPLTGKYVVKVNYYSTERIDCKFYDDFELPKTSIRLGPTPSVVQWSSDDASLACTGRGCARIHSSASDAKMKFEILDTISEDDATTILYLEMDYRTDVELRVALRCRTGYSEAESEYDVMSLYPTNEWKKIYINLGKTWSIVNHYKNFHVVFYTVNSDGIEGDTYVDNLKVIAI